MRNLEIEGENNNHCDGSKTTINMKTE